MNSLDHLAGWNNRLVDLPGLKAWQHLAPSDRRLYPQEGERVKESAVMVLLFELEGGLHTLLIQRSRFPGDVHSGQLSFPGGKRDALDEDLIATAQRETFEEIGIHSDRIEVVGCLTPLYVFVSSFEITPVIGIMSDVPSVTLSADEATQYYFVPLSKLMDPANLKRTNITRSNGVTLTDVPYFDIGLKVPLWGATAMILSELLEVLKR